MAPAINLDGVLVAASHTLPVIRRRPIAAVADWPQMPAVLARVLAGRGITSMSEVPLTLDRLPSPSAMPGLAEALPLLLEARRANWRILVVGDYDADGATATALMVRGLSMLGFAPPGFLVPDRFRYGYGLSPEIVELARTEAAPDLIITVDNGISSIEGVAAACAAGMRVLITDHHLPGEQLPAAQAIVNPRLDPAAPFHNLAGVGVAFYLILALRSALREAGLLPPTANPASLLDLVALGTVADVVALDQVNRILVEQGLRRLRAGHGLPGIRALLEVGGRDAARVVAQDLGFVVGPRLNAAGRIDDMTRGIACLLCDDPVRAREHALELDTINRERRHIEQGMRDEADRQVAQLREQGELPLGICLHDRYWHEGVVGILASRVKQALHRPVIAFAPAQEKGLLKGSGRSIRGLHLRDVLDAIATRHPDLLHKFGGHAMAAGMTLSAQRLAEFTALFASTVAEFAPVGAFANVVETDGALDDSELTLKNAELLAHAFPWGQGFPAPCFDGEFEVLEQRVVAERHLKLTLGLPASGGIIDAIHFNAALERWSAGCRRVAGVYQLNVNEYRGQRSPQLLFDYLVPA